MTLTELFDFVEDLQFYLEEKNKALNENINQKGG